MHTHTLNLDDLLAMRDLSMQEVKERLKASDEQVETGVKYEKLTGLTKIHNPDSHPAHFYFKNGKPVMLYVGSRKALGHLDPEALEQQLGKPEAELRSRVGKAYNQYVYPRKGVAFSTDGEEVALVEVFPPMSLEDYESEIYDEPGPFVK